MILCLYTSAKRYFSNYKNSTFPAPYKIFEHKPVRKNI